MFGDKPAGTPFDLVEFSGYDLSSSSPDAKVQKCKTAVRCNFALEESQTENATGDKVSGGKKVEKVMQKL